MPQHSKLLRSRDSWKEKATERALEIKELRKSHKQHKHTLAQHRHKIKELEAQLQKKISTSP